MGNLAAAGECLRELPRRLLAGGLNDPTPPVWADAIETLIVLGELERVRSYLEPYELHADRLGSPLARAGAARCRGLLLAAEGELASALSAFERSIADAEPFPLEHARTLLCLGMVRRQAQQKKAAREALEQALVIFEGLGARLWAEKARAELKRISGRAPASDELTETERRVAELAARRSHEQGDRGRAVHGREHGRGPPLPRVSQARRSPSRARRTPSRAGRRVCAHLAADRASPRLSCRAAPLARRPISMGAGAQT